MTASAPTLHSVPPAAAPLRLGRMSRPAAFYLQASIALSFLAGSSAPTPLYPLYQAAWGFSSVTITAIFGIYALAVLAALLIAGRLSDHVGRRPVLLVATLAQALAMLVLGTADGVTGLLVGRVIQGLAAGAAVAAVGAGLLDLDKTRGPVANAIAPIMGTASGALVAGLMVHFLPSPTHLVYAVFGAIFVLQFIGLLLMPESVTPRAGALASLRPQLAVPKAARASMLVAAPVLVAVWALAGFFGALAPAVVRAIFGLDASLFGGLSMFVLAASGALAILLLQSRPARQMMVTGASSLLVGVGGMLAALSLHSPVVFFAASAIAGAGFGLAFQGAIRTVVPHAAPHERAGVLSVAFVISYLAMGLPAVAAGYAIVHGVSLLGTADVFGGFVMLLALLALLGMALKRPANKTKPQAA